MKSVNRMDNEAALADRRQSPARRKSAMVLLSLGVAAYVCASTYWFHDDDRIPFRKFGVPAITLALVTAAMTVRNMTVRERADAAKQSSGTSGEMWFEPLRQPTAARRRWMTLLIALTSACYLGLTALRQHRDFNLRVQDEMMYLLQVRMLASGHLYLPAHPMADFFQTFYIFAKPVYASMYFPGASLMFVPAAWLHCPMWVISLLICGGVVGMTYRVTAELTDGAWGILAAVLVVAVPTVRTLSLQVLSYMPMALLGLLLIWAYLHFRKERRITWAAVIGLLAGWAAITRPLDAICFALPIGTAMLIDLRRDNPKRAIAVIGVGVACALPFLWMQLTLNHAVTGRWLRTPVQKYEELYWPGVVFGLHPHLLPGEHKLATELPRFRDNFERFVLPHFTGMAKVKPRPFAQTLEWTLPQPVLIVLLPIGLLALRDARRRIVWGVLLLFPIAYFAWVMFLPYYAAVVAPIVAFAVVLGARQVVETFAERRAELSICLASAIFALALVSLPEFAGKDKTSTSPAMQKFNELAASIHAPAVVFFRYPLDDPMAWRHEQTYNVEAANIDDQPIVRAQDLGERNVELIRYYADKQPSRKFYRFDQKMMTLRMLD